MTGGLTKNPLFVQAISDATSCDVVLPKEPDSVLLGSAMLGAVAARAFENTLTAMQAMSSVEKVVLPNNDDKVKDAYERRFKVLMQMIQDQRAYRQIMTE
jgi:ribulose kinase